MLARFGVTPLPDRDASCAPDPDPGKYIIAAVADAAAQRKTLARQPDER